MLLSLHLLIGKIISLDLLRRSLRSSAALTACGYGSGLGSGSSTQGESHARELRTHNHESTLNHLKKGCARSTVAVQMVSLYCHRNEYAV